MAARGTAAIVTVGSELAEGLRVDTNTAEIARELSRRGFAVAETVSVGDDADLLAAALARLVATHALVVTTGGLGPTHDDITREAAARRARRRARRPTATSSSVSETCRRRHTDPGARGRRCSRRPRCSTAPQVLARHHRHRARAARADTGRACSCCCRGRLARCGRCWRRAVAAFAAVRAAPAELGVDGHVRVRRPGRRAAGARRPSTASCSPCSPGPGDVRVLLIDDGAGERATRGRRRARSPPSSARRATRPTASRSPQARARGLRATRGLTIATAESCTGGHGRRGAHRRPRVVGGRSSAAWSATRTR